MAADIAAAVADVVAALEPIGVAWAADACAALAVPLRTAATPLFWRRNLWARLPLRTADSATDTDRDGERSEDDDDTVTQESEDILDHNDTAVNEGEAREGNNRPASNETTPTPPAAAESGQSARHAGAEHSVMLGAAGWRAPQAGGAARMAVAAAAAPFPAPSSLGAYLGCVLQLVGAHADAELLAALETVFPRAWTCLLQVGDLDAATLTVDRHDRGCVHVAVDVPVALARLQEAYPAICALWRFLRTFELRVLDAERRRVLLVMRMECSGRKARLGLVAAASRSGTLLWLTPDTLRPLRPLSAVEHGSILPLAVDLASNVALLWRSFPLSLPTVQCVLEEGSQPLAGASRDAATEAAVSAAVCAADEAGMTALARLATRAVPSAVQTQPHPTALSSTSGSTADTASDTASESATSLTSANAAAGRFSSASASPHCVLRITGFTWASRMASSMASLLRLQALLATLQRLGALVFWAAADGTQGGMALAAGVPSRGLHGLLMRQVWAVAVRRRVLADAARLGADFCAAAAADIAALPNAEVSTSAPDAQLSVRGTHQHR